MASKSSGERRSGVLVAILNNKADFAILQEQRWYRIPVVSAPRRWPPKWLAFYQTKVFGPEAYKVKYYGRVAAIQTVRRAELFPNEIESARADRVYYRLRLESVEPLLRAHDVPALSVARQRDLQTLPCSLRYID